MATAELAVSVSAVVVLLALTVGAVSLGIDQVRCVDAARAGARSLARGDSTATAGSLSARAAPSGARVALASGGGLVHATVATSRSLLGLGEFTVTGSATAASEDAEAGP